MRLTSLRGKLFYGASAIVLMSLLVVSSVVYLKTNQVLTDMAYDRLRGVRDTRKNHIEFYFGLIRDQVETFALDPVVVAAMKDFKRDHAALADEADLSEAALTRYRGALSNYYQREFIRRLDDNHVARRDVAAYLPESPGALYLQHQYIAANPAETGAKDTLDAAPGDTAYNRSHGKYHPVFRNFLKHFGYYDIFLVHPETGEIIYSVFKEVDYTTSLLNGPYAQTNFGEVFQKVRQATTSDASTLVDFDFYVPSYGAPASFIGAPIFDQGRLEGVLIFQMPVDELNRIMTGEQKWRENGLGETGETILVGKDRKLRSLSRPFLEKPKVFGKGVVAAGLSPELADNIARLGTTILALPLVNDFVTAAFKEAQGTREHTNYIGREVLASFAKLNIKGLDWVLVAEIEKTEALAASGSLALSIFFWGVLVLIGAMVLALVFANSMIKPIDQVNHALADINSGEGDLTRRLSVRGRDEVADLSGLFNEFISSIAAIVARVIGEAQQLQSSAHSVDERCRTMQQFAADLDGVAANTTAACEQLLSGMREAGQRSSQSSSSMNSIASATEELATSMKVIAKTMNESQVETEEAAAKFTEIQAAAETLNRAADDIGQVVDFIEKIAEQTRLLALNATIEASRAGDAGRGFSVVAGEVKDLASQAASAVGNIRERIESLQKNAGQVTRRIGENEKAIRTIKGMIIETATAVEQQQNVTRDIAGHTARVNSDVLQTNEDVQQACDISENIRGEMERVLAVGKTLNDAIGRLNQDAAGLVQIEGTLSKLVGRFRV